jgi:uncharacterized protein YndB with AHSA1/START domain
MNEMATKNQTKIIADPGKQELFIVREFDAPRELVFKAFTDPKLLVKWLGPRRLTMKIDKFDCRANGSYRYFHTDDKGNQFGFHGVIHEVVAPERIIQTFEFEGLPESGHVMLEIAEFDELPGGRTKVTNQSIFRSVVDRDGMVQSGMEGGVRDSHERLQELFDKGAIN